MRVLWSPTALRQLTLIAEYLDAFDPRAARQVFTTLVAEGDSLAEFPYRGRMVPRTEMRELVSVYPYTIRYRIARDGVRILRVRHTSRRPTTP